MKYVVLLLVLVLASCSSQTITDTNNNSLSLSNVTITGNRTLQIGQNLEVNIYADSVIRIPQATYYTKAGPWQIFRKEGNNWQEIEFFSNCYNSCKNVCTDPIQCVPGGPYPGCSRVRDGYTHLKWDLRELQDTIIQCQNEGVACKNPEFIEPGQYKVVFSYRDDCAAGVSWTLEESPIFKKEFLFEVLP